MKGQFKLGHTHGQRDIFTFRAASLQIRSSKERIKTNTYLLFSFSCLIWCLTRGGWPYANIWRKIQIFDLERHPLGERGCETFHKYRACKFCSWIEWCSSLNNIPVDVERDVVFDELPDIPTECDSCKPCPHGPWALMLSKVPRRALGP